MFNLASYRYFAVQSGTYCHKDSLFKDKVKPMPNFSSYSFVNLGLTEKYGEDAKATHSQDNNTCLFVKKNIYNTQNND